jgi:excisionase family DNA binding protein
MSDIQKPILLTRKEAAEYLGVKSCTLDVWASTNRYLKYIKIGRHVRYRKEHLDEFLSSRTINSSNDS